MNRKQLLVDLGLIDATKPELSRLNVEILDDYNDDELETAVVECLKSTSYNVKVADIVKYFENVWRSDMTAKAERAYHLLCASHTTYDDVIIDDAVAGVTIKQLYNSVQEFNRRSIEQCNTDFALKIFVERYLEIAKKYGNSLTEPVYHYFAGHCRMGDESVVEFIGDYYRCKELAQMLYGFRKVRLPLDPFAKLSAPKSQPEKPLSKEESKKVMERVMQFCRQVHSNHD